MRNCLIAAAVAALALAAPAAHAVPREADCLLVVDGKTYIDGPCIYHTDGGGSFTISGNGYAAIAFNNTDGTATGQWGKSPIRFGPYADLLGTLHRAGACQVGARAKICAWKPGEKRYFTE